MLATFTTPSEMRLRPSPSVRRPSVRVPEPTTVPPVSVYPAIKRVVDVLLALAMALVAAPVVLFTAILVKLTSRGPAFYTQVRLGRGGVPFTIYKIRTMHVDSERESGPKWATPNDPRIFAVGRVLRSLHLDELPQLFNVLRGDMALIGPRPERPSIADSLERDLPAFPLRLQVRPGLTGLAQVQFPADTNLASVRRKLAADLWYIATAGPWLDLRILFATVLYLFHAPLPLRQRVMGLAPTAAVAAPRVSSRVGSIQGLRALACSLVFLVHFLTLFGGYLGSEASGFAVRAVDSLARNGTLLFLLISGYLIYGISTRPVLDYGRFLRNRARKIYPPFLCVFVLYLGLSAAFPAESKIPADPVAAVWYLLQNVALLSGLTGAEPLIVVTWTLSYEVALYLTVPVIVRLSGMQNWSPLARVAAIGYGLMLYLAFCTLTVPGHVRLGVYLAGCLAYEVVRMRDRISGAGQVLGLAAILGGLTLLVLLRTRVLSLPEMASGETVAVQAALVAATFFALAWTCFGGDGLAGRVLAWTPLQRLGDLSYSFYLTHGLVLKAGALAATSLLPLAWRTPALFWLALPACYVAALATAGVLYLLVEKRAA